MPKCTPKKDSELDNTRVCFINWSNCETTRVNLRRIDNTLCLIKPLLNDQKYPKSTQ